MNKQTYPYYMDINLSDLYAKHCVNGVFDREAMITELMDKATCIRSEANTILDDFIKYRYKLEHPEEQSTNQRFHLLKCPVCEKDVSSEAVTCPYCGHPFRQDARKQTNPLSFWGIVGAFLVALIIFSLC